MYKAIVEARPPGLDFVHAATQVRLFVVEILMDSIHCRTVYSVCSYTSFCYLCIISCVFIFVPDLITRFKQCPLDA